MSKILEWENWVIKQDKYIKYISTVTVEVTVMNMNTCEVTVKDTWTHVKLLLWMIHEHMLSYCYE